MQMQVSMPARGTHKRVTSVSVAIGDDCLTEHMQHKSHVFTGYRWPHAKEENINIERKTCFNLVLYMEIVTGVFVYGPLCVCFQSSDSEVRRLSKQLSQRDGALQQLEQERDRLVQLDQVRPQKDALSNTPLKRKSINARFRIRPIPTNT